MFKNTEQQFCKLFTFMHLVDALIQSNLHYIQAIIFIISLCVPWELNPQPFALVTQCSATEPQEHIITYRYTRDVMISLQNIL